MSRPTSTPGLPPASPAPMRTLATQVHGDDARGDSDLVTPGTDALVRSGGGTGVTGARQVNTSYSPSTEGGSNRSEQNLQSGFKWGGSTMGTAVAVTYSFTSATSTYTYAEQALPGRFAFSDTAGALAAMAAYSDVSLLTFNQLADTASSAGDIRWGMTTTTAVTSAYASFPSNTAQGGDIWFGPNVLPFLPVADGNYAFHTFMHELGHAVGLDHPHEALVTPVAGEDQMKYSVMSYRSYAGDDVGGAYTNDVFPRTLMINDIQAVQFLYGVNTTTATGDNLYSWGAFESVFETIWDAGGNDTLSAATQQQGSTLFLTPGKWSQIGQSYFNGQALVRDTLTIAYDVVIENALGSDFTDTLEGNTAANRLDGASGSDLLSGLGGNDTLIGGFGSDTLDGGPGADRFEPGIGTGDVVIGGADADTLVLPGQRAQYTITAPAAGDLLLVRTATGENITARQVESFAFSDVTLPVGDITPLPSATSGADTLTGTSADNLIDGLGGNDSLSGLGGNDTLVGGTGLDTLAGGPGDDTYEVDVPGDRITEAAPDGFDTMVIVAGATGSFALPLNVEKANVLSTLAVNVTGNASDNTLWGDAGPNSLNGGLGHDAIVGFGGNDTLVGADGLDTLTGGAGNDTLDGGAGNDLLTPRGGVDTVAGGTDTDTLVLEGNRAAYTITSLNATDLRLLSVALGQDVTVRQVELFQFADGTRTLAAIAPPTAAADTLEGSAGADSIDGLGGNDSISGLGGNDTLVGGPGLDTLAGGADDDVYRVDVPGDVVIESAGGGFDEVEVPASVTVAGTYSVPANVELFNVLSTAAINVLGNEAANVIWGDVGPNSITGAAGNDTLDGYSGNDTLLGGDDADRLRGMIGNDSLDGGAGNDTLVSEIGTDTMSGGPGEDLLQLEGARADYLISAVNATDLQLARTAGGETLLVRQVEWFSFSNGLFSLADIAPPGVPTAGPDMLTGTAGNDSIDGLGGNDSINGQGGNDTLVGGLGLDTLEGGAGNDRYRLDVAGDVVLEGPDGGIDWVDVGFTAVGTYTLPAHVDSAQVTSTQVVHMVGNTLPNTLVGNAAANSLTGGDGNDVLDGGAGRDTLIGGKGDDSYRLDNPLDVVNETAPGSGGYDQVDLFFTVSGSYRLPTGVEVAVNWSSPEVAVTLTGHDAGVVLVGGAGAQTLIGGAGADSLYPEGGNDSVSGGAGRDYLEYLLGPVQINLATGVVTGAGGNDTVSGIEDMAGTSLGDQLVAAPTGSLIYPLGGDDTVEGGVGNDVVHQLAAGLQQLSGGPGTDILILMPEASAGLMVNLPDGLATGPAGFEATIVGFEEVATGDGPDTLIGDDTGNTFRPGAGNDSLSGGKGTDTVSLVDAPSAVQVNLATGRTAGGLGIDTLNSIEQVRLPGFDDAFTGSAGFEYAFGGMGNDTLDGAGGGDWLDGGPGNNSLVGGSGVDTASYIDSSTSVVVNLALSTATHGGGADTLVGVEGVAGSAFADTLSGSDGDNALDGGSGADVLFGGKGSDLVQFKLQGQAVNASLVTNRATVGSVVDTLSGIEHLEGSGGNDTLTGDDGANQLLGGKGADLLTGNGGNDTLVATQGADTVDGGADTDLMVLDDNRSVFTVTRTTATDTRFEAFGTAVVARGIESVSFADGTVSIAELWGNTPSAFDDILTGNGDANAIDGLAGNDSLSGLGGNDTLNGGSGNDTLAGGADDDLYIVDGAGDQVVETNGAGTDTVLTALTVAGTVILPDHVEHGTAQAGTLAISLSGNGLDNRLTGNAGNNSLGGSLGNDTMDGGAGADTLNGSAGDDQYWVDVPADQVNEAPLAGYDIVFIAAGASGSFSFPSQVEQIAIAGGNAVNVLANVTDNFIVAGTGPNSLSGAAGNDTFDLRGTAHGDTVDGGDGVADRVLLAGGVADYRVQRPNATDTVLQAPFETVTLRNIELVSFSDQDVVLSTLFGNAATPGADSLTGTDGDDLIDGLGGNDTLSGGGGSDTLVGGTGIDRLVGGKGNDTYRVDVVTDAVVEELNAGDDLVEVTLATAGSYALPDHVERATAMGTAAVALVGNGLSNLLTGNATGNNLQGGGGADTLDGGAGNDTLAGGAGNDRYLLNASTDQVNETTAGSDGFDTVVLSLPGSGSYTLPAGVEYATVEGSAGSAVNLLGNTLANVLRGHAGNNSLAGGDGGDALWPDVGSDTVDGGNDNDMLVLDATLGNYVITRPSATQVLFTGAGQSVLATGIEQVYTLPDNVSTPLAGLIARIGSPGADTLQGDGFNESLNGVAGNDSVDGGLGGNDTLDGGAGNDTLFGGKGDDLLDGGDGSDTYRFSRDGALDLIEQNDTVAASVDVVQMGSGITAADVSYQRGYFSFDDLVITVGGPSGVDEQVVVLNFFLGDGINPGTVDQVRLASGAITTQAQMAAAALQFDGGGHVFVGYAGNDTINGDVSAPSADWIKGGSGNDALAGLAAADTLYGGGGNDTVSGGPGADMLAGGAGPDTLRGGTGNDTLSGGAGGDRYVLELGDGIDVLHERLDVDLWDSALDSGVGPFYAPDGGDQPGSEDLDVLALGVGIAPDQVLVRRYQDMLFLQVQGTGEGVMVPGYFAPGVPTLERILFSSGSSWSVSAVRAMVLVPTAGGDALTGYLGADALAGLEGDDILEGREGNDTLTGGEGADTLMGGNGRDRFVFNRAADGTSNLDIVLDFTPGVDRLVLSKAVFTALTGAVGTLLDPDTNAFVGYNPATGALTYDADGEGTGAAAVTVALLGVGSHPAALGLDVMLGS